MKTTSIRISLTAAILLLTGALVAAQEIEEDADRTLSPYFFVKSDDPSVDQLPLKSTAVRADIAGVIADVTVTQVYMNQGQSTLEAIYVFPASTRAAVYGMQMRIGQRLVVAQIREREQARQEYEQAKEEGKSASLLEQARPNVFQMNVANILPGDTIAVELRYTELLVPTEGLYEFMYPTVVGPRYSEKSASSGEEWIESPYQHEGEAPTYTFDLTVTLAAGLPIDAVTCTSHQVHVDYQSPSQATIRLDASEAYGGNRDYILGYRLAGSQIESGLLLHQGAEENFFLLMLQPPKRVDTHQISPREYVFIVDVSGSMHGFPLDISKALLRDLLTNLRSVDRFNVLLFAAGSTLLSPESLEATEAHIALALDVIDNQQGGGGTQLLPALQRALALPRAQEAVSRTIVIATDGYVAVEPEVFDLMRERLGEANMFAFGIGSAVNRFLIEGMARVGMGEPFIITKPEEAPAQAEQFRQYIGSPVLARVAVDFGAFDAYDVEPPSLPDVLAERPVIVFGKWRGQPQGTITLTGFAADGPYTAQLDAGSVEPLESNAALRYLWARHRIALRSDYYLLDASDALVDEITQLGLAYNLLTAYTSFVAIDQVVRADGQIVTVKQPLPMPQGVSDYAVGEASYGATGVGAREQVSNKADESLSPTAAEEEQVTGTWLGKSFHLVDGVWMDDAYQPGTRIEPYVAAAGQPEELARFAQLGQHMVVVADGRAYRLSGGLLPVRPILDQNVPNPFNAATVVRFEVPPQLAGEPIRLVVYDLAGQAVRVLSAGAAPSGVHSVVWDGTDDAGSQIASGVYICRLETSQFRVTRRMVLLR